MGLNKLLKINKVKKSVTIDNDNCKNKTIDVLKWISLALCPS